MPNGAVGLPYSASLVSTGDRPIHWKLDSGQLPPGLALGSDDGSLSGTPSQPGAFTFTVKSTESGTLHSNDGRQAYSVTIAPKLVPEATVPFAQVGESYMHTVQVAGGTPPYHVVVKGLPAHFAFNGTTATISGNPTFSGTYTLELDVDDSGDPKQSVVGSPQLVIRPVKVSMASPAQLPGGTVGTAYSTTLQTHDGSGDFQWGITAGSLPSGLHLDPTSGEISGTPTQTGTAIFTVQVADLGSPPDTASGNFSITVQ